MILKVTSMDYVLKSNMEKIEKLLKYTKLFNLYGALLSEAQSSILNDYYFADLSISEISENKGISRSAVEDALKKGSNKLDEFESKLHCLEKNEKLRQKLDELYSLVDDEPEKEYVKKLMEDLENGIYTRRKSCSQSRS